MGFPPDGPNPGLATEHMVIAMYKFLQQEDVKGTKSIILKVSQDNEIVSQITVNTQKFVAGEYLIKSVLDASDDIVMMTLLRNMGK
ncbi:hypothetical protein CGZ75_04325 [Paenibacillus herberti]|uniref:Uncharacterized protein n=2 Tax=Paenibacillus herberti TaxID=1619309 RepID=A0A229P1K9_9BACL|nr:hypothetical protein CGZ75_04325 [Paenibacillus herberti]